jgi:hypothetical protein
MATLTWIPTAVRLPKDGETVLAKSRHVFTPQRVTFHRHPAPRWQGEQHSYQFEFFDMWAVMLSEASS